MLYEAFRDHLKKEDWNAAEDSIFLMRQQFYPQSLISASEHLLQVSIATGSLCSQSGYSADTLSAVERQQVILCGASLLGPPLALFYHRLFLNLEHSAIQGKLFFLAREGFFLLDGFNQLKANLNLDGLEGAYINISRVLLFRCLLDSPEAVPLICHHDYNGTVYSFLKSRCGLHDKEIKMLSLPDHLSTSDFNKPLSLPHDLQDITSLLRLNRHLIAEIIQPTKAAYLGYLRDNDFFHADVAHVVDVGYSGTIQKALSLLTGQDIVGHYLITTKAAQSVGRNLFNGYVHAGISWGDGYGLLDKSLYLESLLTAPNGSTTGVNSVDEGYVFEYGRSTRAQHCFGVLELAFAGCLDYCSKNILAGTLMTPSEIDQNYLIQTSHPAYYPDALRYALELEDDFSGIGTINPYRTYAKQS